VVPVHYSGANGDFMVQTGTSTQ